jgi:UV DNA damage repair endonuclease
LRDNVRRLRSGRGVQTAPPLSALTMEKKGAVTKQQTVDTRDDDASDSSVKQHTSTDVDGKSVDELFDRIQTRLIPNADVSKPHRQNVEQKSKRKRRKKLKKNTTNDNDGRFLVILSGNVQSFQMRRACH